MGYVVILLLAALSLGWGLRLNPQRSGLTQTSPVAPLRAIEPKQRKIVGKDNLGEPIYEGDENSGESLNVLGAKVPVDPLSASLLVFAVIAFQFFVVANL